LGSPGMLVRSVPITPDGVARFHLGNYVTDHRSPLEERWGGWFVTGGVDALHMGNCAVPDLENPEKTAPVEMPSTDGRYLAPHSDVAALMVFDHQMRMMNLLTHVSRDIDSVREFVDYLLFVDEAPLTSKLRGTSGFAGKFAAQGPRDTRGRSLRQLDLEHRLLRYPCSYMIYSEAFDALPAGTKDAIYRRMWQILSGEDRDAKYARLSSADRRAIVEILRETKPDFQPRP
jgi:hypothetical protein